MTQKDYKNLNYYLNGCFKKLEKKDSFLLRNIAPIIELSEEYIHLTNHYEFENDFETNHLTYEDVYLLAREIIENIDKEYLKYYDNLIESGELDFSYNNSYFDSHFSCALDNSFRLININRNFSYSDVIILIHEFMHYINGFNNPTTVNQYLLTEFISIYFEQYAKNYLLNKGIPREELFFNERIIYTKYAASNFNWYSLIILAYEKFGNINENTWQLLSEYYLNISKEDFERECKNLLMKLKKIENDYKMKIMFENDFKEIQLFDEQINLFNRHYKYILGTILAYYVLEQNKLEQMVYLCNHINDHEYIEINLFQVLETIGIDIEQVNLKPIENFLVKNNAKKVK